jgi:hypothetical protein
MSRLSSFRIQVGLLVAIGGAYFVYVVWRAACIPITVDEGYTIMTYVPKSWRAIVLYDYNEISANNHLLNTLWIKAQSALMGTSLLGVRSANWLACGLYVAAGIGLVRATLRDTWQQVGGLVLWLAHPCMSEFFGIARGYGLSFGWIGFSLWMAVLWFKNDQNRYFWGAVLGVWLAVAASFSTLSFYLMLVGVLAWQVIFLRKKMLPRLAALGVATASLAALLYHPVAQMRREGTFDMFGRTGFYEDLVRSFARYFFRGEEPWGEPTYLWFSYFLGGVCGFSGLVFLVIWFRQRTRWTGHALLLAALPLTLATNVVLTRCTDATWLVGRTNLFFFPLVAAALIGLVAAADRAHAWLARVGVALVAVFFGFNFFQNANLRDVMEWSFDRDTFRVLDHLKAVHQREQRSQPIRMGCFWVHNPSFAFHLKHGPGDWGRYIVPHDPPWIGEPRLEDDFEYFYAGKDQAQSLDSTWQIYLEVHCGERFLLRRR